MNVHINKILGSTRFTTHSNFTDYTTHWDEINTLFITHHRQDPGNINHLSRLCFENGGNNLHNQMHMIFVNNRLLFTHSPTSISNLSPFYSVLEMGLNITGTTDVLIPNDLPSGAALDNVLIDSNGVLYRDSSSKLYKKEIKNYNMDWKKVVRGAKLKSYKLQSNNKKQKPIKTIGYIAEQISKLNEYLPVFRKEKKTGKKFVGNYDWKVLIFALMEMAKVLVNIDLDALAEKFPNKLEDTQVVNEEEPLMEESEDIKNLNEEEEIEIVKEPKKPRKRKRTYNKKKKKT